MAAAAAGGNRSVDAAAAAALDPFCFVCTVLATLSTIFEKENHCWKVSDIYSRSGLAYCLYSP